MVAAVFKLENHDSCGYDSVSIFDGSYSIKFVFLLGNNHLIQITDYFLINRMHAIIASIALLP